jgi:FHA domain
VVTGPDERVLESIALYGDRVTIGRLPDANDIALQPDAERLVTRAGHCALEREGASWFVVDGGSVNGTFLRRDGALERVRERMLLRNGDVISVLASVSTAGEHRYFELAFLVAEDSQATRAVAPVGGGQATACLSYDGAQARLLLVRGSERQEIRIRAQAHRLVRYMAERNAAAGSPALCTHEELMRAVWAEEPLHSRVELARIVWELRKKLEPFGAEHLIENERRLGYRLQTCPSG